MPLLRSGAERCVLSPGTYTLGGRGSNALPLASLEWSPEVATIVVPEIGPPMIQRLSASVVVKLNQVPIGIAAKPLQNGVEIEFPGCRVTFLGEDDGEALIASTATGEAPSVDHAVAEPPASATRMVRLRTGDAVELNGHRIAVGRDEACDLVLSGMNVSRRHFTITPVQEGYLLRDESANGTLVNGARVSGTYLLGHGDVVRVDDEELRFDVDGRAAPALSTVAAPTAILDVRRLRSELATEGAREQLAALAASLEIVRGPYSGASFSIDRPVCAIGRGPQNDVQIRDASVSGSHATLLRKGPAWFVVDLRSANGTFVDGSRIAGERELTTGARLKLGRVEMVFRAVEGGVEPPVETRRKRAWLAELFKPFRRTAANANG